MPKTKYPIFKYLHRGEKGFTLIELLIVIAILGIIAAVVIPNISSFMTSGNLAAANSELEQVKTGELGYFGDHGYWPGTSTDLSPNYISGVLKATYTFDGTYGWVMTGNATVGGWQGITFSVGTTGSNGTSGHWSRP
ncbi:MAG: type II secretion system protein [Dehalococcoidia bacterium]